MRLDTAARRLPTVPEGAAILAASILGIVIRRPEAG
jgi:hypothetical protein